MPGTTAWGARLTPTTTTTTEGRPQGDRPEGHQEHLEHPERQTPLGREDQGREVRLQMGDQEHREPLGRGDQEHRGDMHRCEGVEEYLVR